VPEPLDERRLGAAAKFTEVALSGQKRLLHDVGRVNFSLKAPANLLSGQQTQIVSIAFQQPTLRGAVSATRLPNCRDGVGHGTSYLPESRSRPGKPPRRFEIPRTRAFARDRRRFATYSSAGCCVSAANVRANRRNGPLCGGSLFDRAS
jgi:hypothetical protein